MGRQPLLEPALMHPRLLPRPFHHDGWIYEEKIDDYRMVAVKANGAIQLLSRQGRDHTKRFPEFSKALVGSARSHSSLMVPSFLRFAGPWALGYVEGQSILLESRFADGKPERVEGLARNYSR